MPISPSILRVSGTPPVSAQGRRRRGRALLCSALAAAAVTAGLAEAAPAQAASQVLLGSAGDAAAMSRGTGEPMAVHTYRNFSDAVPTGADMITVGAGGASWRTVANAGAGSSLYADIARWAQTIKSRPGPLMLAYQHEPEGPAGSGKGTSSDFIAAYRHVVSIFRAQGVTNVTWVWQMTAYSFRAKPGDRRYAATWYPGDGYVDVVGGDGYNWAACYGHSGAWLSMASFTDPIIGFARAHGKQASLPEFGAAPDSRRAQWLSDSHSYIAANRSTLTSVFYFNRSSSSGCSWALRTAAEYQAYGDMARDAVNFRS